MKNPFREDALGPRPAWARKRDVRERCVWRAWARLSRIVIACLTLGALDTHADEEPIHAGFLFDKFDLTLTLGTRTEAAGPFYYNERAGDTHTWGVPPIMAHTTDVGTDSEEFTFAYPVMSYARYGEQYRWQLFQLLSWSGGPSQSETERNRFTLFPIYFQQRSTDPSQNYTAVGPFYGHLQNRLFRDEIEYVMFPLYSRTRKRNVVTRNYLYPIFHLREGDALEGWQVWPLFGHELKGVTTRTNGFGDVEVVGGHNHWFALWPIYFNAYNNIGTENLSWQHGVLPLYSLERSEARDATTILWPFFSKIDDRGRGYREWQVPFPFLDFARGGGKTINRVWPIWGKAQGTNLTTGFLLWPLYRYNHLHSPPLDRVRKRVLLFLYSDTRERNTQMNTERRRIDFLPFFSHRRDTKGNTRLQVLAILEPFLPGNDNIERQYSHFWSLWRSEKNRETSAASQSLLWNLYSHQTTADSKRVSVLFGLYQYRRAPNGRQVRLFHVLPIGKWQRTAEADSNSPKTAMSMAK
jgi:hypothetical protein